MAIIWRQESAGKHYEVRRAGSSLRLYTNGAFHSQYNPRHLFTGAVWDLLTLPVLYAPDPPRKLLVLGLGGGTAVHQLNRLLAECDITAVELDPVHIDVARRLFRVEAPNVTLVQADALAWIRRHRATWDAVIDDLFLDAPNDPERPQPVDAAWLTRLASRTRRHGMVIQNHLSPRLVEALLDEHAPLLERYFRTALMFTTPRYENAILALYRDRLDVKRAGRLALGRVDGIRRGAAGKLRFRCTCLFQGDAGEAAAGMSK